MLGNLDIDDIRARLAETREGLDDAGAKAALDKFESDLETFDAQFNAGQKSKAMLTLLPYVQWYTSRRLPPVTGFMVMFTYRLTMLARSQRELLGV